VSDNIHQQESSTTPPASPGKSATVAGTPAVRTIEPCGFRTAGQLSNEQHRSVTALHETWAKDVSHSLGAYLRVGFELTLASVEQFVFRDALTYLGMDQHAKIAALRNAVGAPTLPSSGPILPLRLQPTNTTCILYIELELALAIIDLLLGGSGASPSARELTDIDETVILVAGNLLARQLENAWRSASVEITADECVNTSHLQQFFPSTERMLLLNFTGLTCETTGAIKLLVPAAFLSSLLRQAGGDRSQQELRIRSFPKPTLSERLLDAEFNAALEIPKLRIPVRELLELVPGAVLHLRVPVKEPGYMSVAGRPLFEAVAVRRGEQRAAQLGRAVSAKVQEMQL